MRVIFPSFKKVSQSARFIFLPGLSTGRVLVPPSFVLFSLVFLPVDTNICHDFSIPNDSHVHVYEKRSLYIAFPRLVGPVGNGRQSLGILSQEITMNVRESGRVECSEVFEEKRAGTKGRGILLDGWRNYLITLNRNTTFAHCAHSQSQRHIYWMSNTKH